MFFYIRNSNDEFNTKTRRLQSITNNNSHDTLQNNYRTPTPVDSFVQLNLTPSIDIKLEDYKKVRYGFLFVFFLSFLICLSSSSSTLPTQYEKSTTLLQRIYIHIF